MNKTELLNKFSKDADERVVLARALDQMDRAANRSIPCATQFLSPAQRAALEPLLVACAHPKHLFHGGFEGAERMVTCNKKSKFPACCFHTSFSKMNLHL